MDGCLFAKVIVLVLLIPCAATGRLAVWVAEATGALNNSGIPKGHSLG